MKLPTTTRAIPDRAKGILWDFNNDAHAVGMTKKYELGESYPTFIGVTLTLDQHQVNLLDHLERHAHFRRIMITTEKGFEAWAYEYLGKIPADARRVVDWSPSHAHKQHN